MGTRASSFLPQFPPLENGWAEYLPHGYQCGLQGQSTECGILNTDHNVARLCGVMNTAIMTTHATMHKRIEETCRALKTYTMLRVKFIQ